MKEILLSRKWKCSKCGSLKIFTKFKDGGTEKVIYTCKPGCRHKWGDFTDDRED